jgi:LEA14-like dessication related protein
MVVAIIVATLVFGFTWVIREEHKSIQDLQLSLRDIKLIGFNFLPGKILPSSMTLEMVLDAHNPNDLDVTIYDLEYGVFINELFVGNGSLSNTEKITIPQNQSRKITIIYTANLTVLPAVVITTIQNLIDKEESYWEVMGIVYVDTPLGKDTYPFSWIYPPMDS